MGKAAGQAPFEDSGLYWERYDINKEPFDDKSAVHYSAVYHLCREETVSCWFGLGRRKKLTETFDIFSGVETAGAGIDLLIAELSEDLQNRMGYRIVQTVGSWYSVQAPETHRLEERILQRYLKEQGLTLDEIRSADTRFIDLKHKRIFEDEMYKLWSRMIHPVGL